MYIYLFIIIINMYVYNNIYLYIYIITHTLKQQKNTITRYKYIGSTWEKHKKKFLVKKKTKNKKLKITK